MNQTPWKRFGNRLAMRMFCARGGRAQKGPRERIPRAFRIPPVGGDQTVNELPQPQPPLAFGLLNVKPEPWKVLT